MQCNLIEFRPNRYPALPVFWKVSHKLCFFATLFHRGCRIFLKIHAKISYFIKVLWKKKTCKFLWERTTDKTCGVGYFICHTLTMNATISLFHKGCRIFLKIHAKILISDFPNYLLNNLYEVCFIYVTLTLTMNATISVGEISKYQMRWISDHVK